MKKMRGFTLIECLVALAILGIGSLIMAQIYASVCNVNRMNHQNNSSIANQMKYVEKKTNSESIPVYSNAGSKEPKLSESEKKNGRTPPVNSTTKYNITLKRDALPNTLGSRKVAYSYAVDYYVLQTRDQNDNAKYNSDGTRNNDYNNIFKPVSSTETNNNQSMYLNYKYFTGYKMED
ncbi:MAG: prepilin-type N-terminal cleavage/methylation domain-containing protein [Oscillospiraceae bacterium]